MTPVRGRRQRLARRRQAPELQLATTSDIAFLLLIFFISTAIFVSPRGLPLLLAPAGASAEPVTDEQLAVVRLGAAGEITAGGAARTPQELTAWAASVQASRPGMVFALEAHASCPYEAVVRAIDALRGAAVARLGFSLVEAK